MTTHSVICDPGATKTSARRLRLAGVLAGMWALVGVVLPVRADPIPKGTHNRTVDVRLTREAVVVTYRLDVEPYTAVFEDLLPLAQGGEFDKLSSKDEFYETFRRVFAPRLAAGLKARLDDEPLSFRCTERRFREVDPENHLRFEFVFRADWKPRPDADHTFAFREANFEGPPGQVTLALNAGRGIRRLVPRLPLPPDLEADEQARRVKTSFRLTSEQPSQATEQPKDTRPPKEESNGTATGKASSDMRLLELLFDTSRAFWILLCLAAFWGAGHALSPGHGKTLVAAYLVGERGTVAQAFLLGLVTTLTHTGVVLILALVLKLKYPHGIPTEVFADIQQALKLGSGIFVAGLGFWLFLRRLAGKADHVHLGVGHHHHHHGHHHHDHDHDHTHEHPHNHAHDHDHVHDHVHPVPGGWRGLVALGVSGGIVPCPTAVVLLVLAVAANQLERALPLLLAFSAGLASVLVLIGILVVRTKFLAGKRWERSRLFRALPVVSAVLVACLGLVLCYDSLRITP
ncbi:MAG TPA: sulfite exporter TauE/SafE family protein [Gemmataceae bacterium]|nr:sulfite exporter TauE/SafE family protein [Gemmataceae bacterium]